MMQQYHEARVNAITDEEIENQFPYAVSYANMCSQIGAKWLRDKFKITRNEK